MANWIPPQLAEASEHARSLSSTEYLVFYLGEFPWGCGIDEVFAWRGHIARKLLGRMPKPDEVDVKAGNAYWEPDTVFISETRNRRGEVVETTYRRRGRRLSENNREVRRIKERRSRS